MVLDKLGFGSDDEDDEDEQADVQEDVQVDESEATDTSDEDTTPDSEEDTSVDDSESEEESPEYESEVREEAGGYTKEELTEEPREDVEANYTPPEPAEIGDVARLHQDFIAPKDIAIEKDMARMEDSWVQNLYVNEWPMEARPGFLEPAFADSRFDTDLSIHIEPRPVEEAEEDMEDNLDEIQAEKTMAQRKDGTPEAKIRDLKKDEQDARQMYDLVSQSNMTLFDVSMYINHHAPTPDALWDQSPDFRPKLEEPPADIDLKTSTRVQDKGLVSTSPVGKDMLGKRKPMMAGAVASMMPFSSATFIEDSGVDFGTLPHNGSPVIVDRFKRDTGYNMLTVGDIGSGKSFSTKLNLLRTIMRRDDVDLIMLDPLEGFVGLNEALGGKKIVVGGDTSINPMELQPTPSEVLENADGLDPYSGKLKDVMSFFETFFDMRSMDLGNERGILEKAIQKSYADKGINREPETHSNESPTIKDVLANLEDMTENPEEYTSSGSNYERERVGDYASQLLVALQPFSEGGEYEQLTEHTEIDVSGERISYLDLQQQEGRGGTGLMMQLLFNSVYERAKKSDNKVIFAIDEARYIMRDTGNLEFLEQAVRHSRHYNLSIQFITQTIEEFFSSDEARAIADNCSLMQLNQLSSLDGELAMEELGLNSHQVNFVRNAQAGDEDVNYSEALLNIDEEGWMPLHIRANESEAAVVDFNRKEGDALEDLPGYGADNENKRGEEITDALSIGIQQSEVEVVGLSEDDGEEAQDKLNDVSTSKMKELLINADFRRLHLDELGEDRTQVYLGRDVDDDGLRNGIPLNADRDVAQTGMGGNGSNQDLNVFHVRIEVNDDVDREDVSLPVFSELSDGFSVFETDPSRLALRAGNYELGFDALMGTPVMPETFCRAMNDLTGVESVVVTDVSSLVNWESENVSTTSNDDLQQASANNNDEVSNMFEQMKEEANFESIDVDENEFESF